MMSDERYTKFGYLDEDDGMVQWRDVRVVGLEYVFKILCLICEIMIYRLPIRDSIDKANADRFKERLRKLEE